MVNPWEQLQPKDSYSVQAAGSLSNLDIQVLTFLYQPIIGIEAYSLMMTLLAEHELSEADSDHAALHSELLNQVNLGLPDFFNARVRLEGIGLIRTFVKEIFDRRHMLYVIQRPLSASDFFKDDILSLFLLDCVGEKKFKKLAETFRTTLVMDDSYTETTKKFVDAYRLSDRLLAGGRELANQVKEKFADDKPFDRDIDTGTFDWQFFTSMLDGLYIDKKQLDELREVILTFHSLYGVDEIQMQQYVMRSVDYVTNRVQINQLKHLIYTAYHGKTVQHTRQADKTEQALTSPEEKKTYRYNSLKLDGFTEGEINVILSSEGSPPMLYLKAIKKQKKGFVTDNERWTVENIRKQSALPDAVINVMIHYILVVQNNASLNQKLANAIANDWAQDGIRAPEDAIRKVQKMAEDKRKKSAAPKRQYKSSGRKETLPEWAKQAPKKETPVSSEEQKALNEKLERLGLSREDGD